MRYRSYRLFLTIFVSGITAARVWAADPTVPPSEPPTDVGSVTSFVELLDQLRAKPEAREAVKKALEQRLQSIAGAGDSASTGTLTSELAEKNQRLTELQQRAASLTEELTRIQSELSSIQTEIPDLQAKLNQSKTDDGGAKAVLEQSLELLKALEGQAPDSPPAAAQPLDAPVAATSAVAEATIGYNRDIRPILSNKCFACHGPDALARKAGLRLDDGKGAFAKLPSGSVAIVPEDTGSSEVWARVSSSDPDLKMPPPEFGKDLTPEEVALIGRWIEQGGHYEKHWSFVAPVMPDVPAVKNAAWPRNAIDNFVLAKLEREGLTPSPEADARTLIRRLTFDLTGLPPTPAEIDAFVNDTSADAYERVVDRLLASPRYGEHMTRYWLDLARYADTNGYHIDNERYMWRWRDWCIESFNKNQPFDQFTIEQLAGDMFPNPTQDQLVATGFNRNHMINFEGGIIAEEYRTQYVIDRVNTTSTVWMGLTMGCVQCHDHKYDPISQKDYYSLYAFFNTISEQGIDGRDGNSVPFIKAPTPEQATRLKELDDRVALLRSELDQPMPEVDAAQVAWEQQKSAALRERWVVLDPSEMSSVGGATLSKLEDKSVLVQGENPATDIIEIAAHVDLTGMTALRLEALPHESVPAGGGEKQGRNGRSENANFVLTGVDGEISTAADPAATQPIGFALANANYSQPTFDVSAILDGNSETGWGVSDIKDIGNPIAVLSFDRPMGISGGSIVRIRLKYESKFAQHVIGRFRLSVAAEPTLSPSRLDPWYINGPYVAADGNAAYTTDFGPETKVDLNEVYPDGRMKWMRVLPDLPDGAIHNLSGGIAATYLYRTIQTSSARTVTLAAGSNDAIKVWLNGQVVLDKNVQRGVEPDQDKFDVILQPGENKLLVKVVNYGASYAFYFRKAFEVVGDVPLDVEAILTTSAESRLESQTARLREYYRSHFSPEWLERSSKVAKAVEERDAYDKTIPTTMVMAEMAEPRETFILKRGQYDQPSEKVIPAVPASLPPLPEGSTNNRLGLAKWLVDPSHPLTARVTVNRMWGVLFGTGIVKTTQDFGAQGEWPVNPQLLDWLAVDFVNSGWDVKRFLKQVVMSSTYRQRSSFTPELLERDPDNRLLARGSRMRFDAEVVRDTALAVSGLLVEKVGGPSVNPYQPMGLWEEVAYGGGNSSFTAQKFVQSDGEGLYRRSMYTFLKRQAPHPVMIVFDAPNRETCTASRPRTNTPLQALMLMNGVQYVEAARNLAQRTLRECGGTPEQCVVFAFELATARKPAGEECEVLVKLYQQQLEHFRAHPESAADLLKVGESKPAEGVDVIELAAWTIVTNTILNLDETITKT
ncbi:MAG: hypothetical protein AMXMBFR84_05610 [Candidatus Hydrogenedentota bacterium]